MKYLLISLLFVTCNSSYDVDATLYYDGQKAAMINTKQIVDSLFNESALKWDTLKDNTIQKTLISGRLDALKQISVMLRDSLEKYR